MTLLPLDRSFRADPIDVDRLLELIAITPLPALSDIPDHQRTSSAISSTPLTGSLAAVPVGVGAAISVDEREDGARTGTGTKRKEATDADDLYRRRRQQKLAKEGQAT
jgi:hypothetical protein